MSEITRKDFTASRKHPGFYTRDLGDNGTGDGSKWVEVLRKDGFSIGATPVPYLDQTIEAFERQKVPMGTGSIDDIFAAPEPAPEPEAEPELKLDAQPAAEVKEGRRRR